MNVVYASNDGYVRHLAASLVSLFDRSRRVKEITVFVISMGISQENKDKLEEIAAGYGRRLRFVELEDVRSRFGYGIDTGGFHVSTMARLFIGSLLPPEVDRVLYLDCDTVAVQPLWELWRTDLRGRTLGAVPEPTIYKAVRREIGLQTGDIYVNAGVLLVDLKRWRSSGAEAKCLEFYREKGGNLFACDQDILNGALKGDILPLAPKYNFFPNYRYFGYRDLVKREPAYAVVREAELKEAKRHPVVIHYAGDERPWIAGNLNHYRRPYEHYLAMTPWAGTPREKGREGYMFLYHMMDYATVICPGLRWFISDHFGMKMVEARKSRAQDRAGDGQ